MKSDTSRDANATAYCPACERFIGPLDACPYCETDSARPPLYRHMRWMALAVGGAGLIFLYLMSARSTAPLAKAAEITPTMNFACVSVTGVVERTPYVSSENGEVSYFSVRVNDGTGAIRVTAYRDTAARLSGAGRFPRVGDRVHAQGTLNVTAGRDPKLRLPSAEQFKFLE